MKKFVLILFSAISITAVAQDEMVYRRSSLHQIYIPCQSDITKMIENAREWGYKITIPENFNPNRDFTPDVLNAWDEYPFPDKYNNHEIAIRNLILPENILDKTALNNKEKKHDVIQDAIEKAINEKQIAKELVKKWFNYNNGKFDMNLVGERGMYNASEMQAAIAKGEARGLASLADAGEELIGNTFVTFSYTKFVPQFINAQIIKQSLGIEISKNGRTPLIDKFTNTINKFEENGYSVVTITYLYKLVWDDNTSNKFYTDFWNNSQDFEADNETFKMIFIGKEYEKSIVLPFKELSDESMVIKQIVIRNLDKMYADLAKNYDVFKPKTPVFTENPTTAQIGKKEGLEGGEKFDVMEMTFDKKEGRTTWKVVGQVVVDKKQIWDNRYAAGQDEEDNVDENIKATIFIGKASVGQFLRQKK